LYGRAFRIRYRLPAPHSGRGPGELDSRVFRRTVRKLCAFGQFFGPPSSLTTARLATGRLSSSATHNT